MILTKSNWTIAMLSLLVGASSCFVSSVDLPVKSFESSVKFPQKVAGETDRQFGKRVCGEKGEGSHTMIPGVDLNDRYQVTCEEHGGFIVYNLNTDELNQFDYPKPVKLSKDQIAEYVADKKVVLFGEEHSEKNRWQTLLFADMVPELKKAGVTHIGLELDRRYQNDIDQYMQNPNFLTQEKLLDELPFLHDFDNEDFVLKINAALDNGLEVMCLDNRDPDRKISRDAHMKKKIDEVFEDIKNKKFDQKIMTDQKTMLVNKFKENLRRNEFWLTVMEYNDQYNQNLERFMNIEFIINSITAHDISQLAKKYLDDKYFRDIQLTSE